MDPKYQIGNGVIIYIPDRAPLYSLIIQLKRQNEFWIIVLEQGEIVFNSETKNYSFFEDKKLVRDSGSGLKVISFEPDFLIPNDLNSTLEVMTQMDDKTLKKTCKINKTSFAICSGFRIWKMRVEYYFPTAVKYKDFDIDWKTYYIQLSKISPDIDGANTALQNYWYNVLGWLIEEKDVEPDHKILESMDPRDPRYLKMLKFLDGKYMFDEILFFQGLKANSPEILQFLHDRNIIEPTIYDIVEITDTFYIPVKIDYPFEIVNWLVEYEYISEKEGLYLLLIHPIRKEKEWILKIKDFIVQHNLISLETLNQIQQYRNDGKYELTRWMVEDLMVNFDRDTVSMALGYPSDESFETFKYLYLMEGLRPEREDINDFFVDFPEDPSEQQLNNFKFLLDNRIIPDKETIKIILNEEDYSKQARQLLREYGIIN